MLQGEELVAPNDIALEVALALELGHPSLTQVTCLGSAQFNRQMILHGRAAADQEWMIPF